MPLEGETALLLFVCGLGGGGISYGYVCACAYSVFVYTRGKKTFSSHVESSSSRPCAFCLVVRLAMACTCAKAGVAERAVWSGALMARGEKKGRGPRGRERGIVHILC